MRRFFLCCLVTSLFALSCLGGGYIDLKQQCDTDADCQTVDPAMICDGNKRCTCPAKKGYELCKSGSIQRCILVAESDENCGKCGNACTAGKACCGGTCIDPLLGDRSQTPHRHCGACKRNCTADNDSCCDGACRNLKRDPQHCGQCGTSCSGGQTCCNGACVDTITGTRQSGKTLHCGKCGQNCGTNTPDCCNGKCVDFQLDKANCGACGTACAQNQVCCNGKCTKPIDDPKACGACGTICKSNEACCKGKCVSLDGNDNCGACGQQCDSGELCCGQRCINPSSDNFNCKACGTSCIDKNKRFIKRQTKDGESFVFKLASLPTVTNAKPLRLSVDAYGDYDAIDEFADIYVCHGDVPDCNANSDSFIKEARINGGNPRCNRSLTNEHKRIFLLSPRDLPGTTVTIRVKLSPAVSYSTCQQRNPRIEVSYGDKQCCTNQCVDTVLFTSLLKSENCGRCGQSCRSGEFCCQGKCSKFSTDDNNCSACGQECNAATQWTRQEKDGEGMRFFFPLAEIKKHPTPLPLKIDIYGDFADDDRFADVYLCAGDVAKCGPGGTPAFGKARVDGDEPRCNTALTPSHSRIIYLRKLPANQALTVYVKLSDEVSYSACAHISPRVVLSIGEKRCCNGNCTDLKQGTKGSDGRITNCGTCGNQCELGEACCDGQCVDTSTSSVHCGACGTSCSAGSIPSKELKQTKNGQTFTFAFSNVPAPTSTNLLRVRVDALADFDASNEYAVIKAFANGKQLSFLDESNNVTQALRLNNSTKRSNNCFEAERDIYFDPAQFSGGKLTIRITYTSAVTLSTCANLNPTIKVSINPQRCCSGQCTTQGRCDP